MISSCSMALRDIILLYAVVHTVYGLSKSITKQCEGQTAEKDSSVSIKNVGIRLCQVKCRETGGCLRFEYNYETLTCSLRLGESQRFQEDEGFSVLQKKHSDIPPGPCAAMSCSFGSRCLQSRSGKVVCVKDEEKHHHSSSPKRKDHKPGDNLLHEASRDGDLCRVQQIVTDSDIDINSREKEHGMTPAMLAAHGGHKDVFDFLVGNGCNLSIVDNAGNNILQMACIGGHTGIVKYIVSLDIVDMNSRGQYERTPMMAAAFHGKREVFKLLLKEGANVTLADEAGDNILDMACGGGHTELAKYLISLNIVEGNNRGRYGRSRLMTAAQMGNREMFETCICAGGNVSEVDAHGNNILHLACCGGDVYIVKYIISHNITDVNSRGTHKRTPAMMAAACGRTHVLDLLVSEGVDVSNCDADLNNILHLACLESRFEMVKYIISQNITDINSRGNLGRTPLMMAAGKSHRGVFDFLVRKGGDTSLKDSNGDNILLLACREGHLGIVNYILSRNITDVNSRGTHWMTPIMVAVSWGQIHVFAFLLSKGGDVTMLDRNGGNILHLASYHGEIEMVRHILSHNIVDINTKNKNGNTAATIAKHRGHWKVYALLNRHGQSGM